MWLKQLMKLWDKGKTMINNEQMEQDIRKLKKRIEQAKQDKAEAEGSLKTLFERLKKEFGVETLEEASKKYESLKKMETEITEELERSFIKLKENYEW